MTIENKASSGTSAESSLAPDSTTNRSAHRPAIKIDYSLYEEHLEGDDMTAAQKRELLDTLWNIIVGFVDLGFGVHPVQQVLDEAQGQAQEIDGDRMLIPPRVLVDETDLVVDCPDKLTDKIKDKNDGASVPSQDRSPA